MKLLKHISLLAALSVAALASAGSLTVSSNNTAPISLALTGAAIVDYSSMMSGYPNNAVAINRNPAWASGLQWYWNTAGADVSAAAGTVEFRRSVYVGGTAPISVYMYGGADNIVDTIAVNGATVINNQMFPFNVWSSSAAFSLQPGTNVVVIRVTNTDVTANPAGFALQIQKMDGSILATESGWKMK